MVDATGAFLTSDGPYIQSILHLTKDLKDAARCNDAFSIDCLFTMALEQDNPNREAAAAFLFDLYSGQEAPLQGECFREQLAEKALNLCQLVFKIAHNPIDIPAKLLLMGGFETQSDSDERAKVLDRLQANHHFLKTMVQMEQPADSTMFNTNRCVTNSELNAMAKILNSPVASLTTFHPARSASQNQSELTVLFAPDRQQVDAIPLIIGEHWLLWVIFTNDDGKRGSLFFDSLATLSAEKKPLSMVWRRCVVRQSLSGLNRICRITHLTAVACLS